MDIRKGTVAAVSGGASGLGAATARALAEAGATVTLFDLNAEKGEALAAELGGYFEKVDVSDSEAVGAALARVAERDGGLHVAVSCAGIGPAAKTVSRGAPHDAALFEKTLRVNLMGTFHMASRAAAIMAAQEPLDADGNKGVIVNTASVAAFEGQVGQVAYSASKGGVVGMTVPMARDLAQHGIRVCTVAPGLFLTPLMEGLSQEAQDSLGKQVPFPARLGDPAEYAALVKHIVENPMLNGEVIRLDGAIRMAPR